MASVSYLQIRRGRYFFRRRYPRWLVLRLGPGEIVKALPPCTHAQASFMIRRLAADINCLLQQIKTNQMDVSEEKLKELAHSIFREILKKFDSTRQHHTDEGQDSAERRLEGAREMIRMQFWENSTEYVVEALKEADIPYDKKSPMFKELCELTLRAYSKASHMHLARYNGDYTPIPDDPYFEGAEKPVQGPFKQTSITLSEVYEKFVSDKNASKVWRKDTVREFGNTFNLALEWFGDKRVDMIDRQSISEFREMLQHLPSHRGKTPKFSGMSLTHLVEMTKSDASIKKYSETTVSKHMAKLSSILDWSMRQGYATDNPAHGVHRRPKRKRAANEERAAWTNDELRRWFSCPIYMGCKSESRRHESGNMIIKDHQYWLPLLALYHPLRAEEIAQLYVDDVLEENGIPYIKIDGGLDNTEIEKIGKQIKNIAARRRNPVHRVLIEIGFMDYVEETRKAGHTRLFHKLTQGGTGERFSAYYCKRFSHYKKQYGIEDATFHSFRHNAITSLSQNHPNTDTNDELAGHTIFSERARYRQGASIKALKVAIDSISHNEIDDILKPN